jgi:hypothetical protein
VNLARLLEQGEAFRQERGREHYLTGAGLKQDSQFQAIYQRFGSLTSDGALTVARSSGSAPLYEWVVDVRVGRAVAPLEDRHLRWEHDAVVPAGRRTIPYLRVPIELANQPDRGARAELDAARVALVASGLNPLLRERFRAEHAAFASFGFGDYVAGVATLSGMDLGELARAGEVFLSDSEAAYHDALSFLVKRQLRVPLSALVRADASWLFRAKAFDQAFPLSGLVELAVRQTRDMGIDASQGGRVRFDTDERPDKQPRAFCVPVRVPEEVYLVLRPRGGHQDYRTLWHELGHALHFSTVDAGRSFTDRWLGDNSVTEGFAMLFDHLTVDRGWLARYGGLKADQVAQLHHEQMTYELYAVRRYVAKLAYELNLHRSDFIAPADEYARRLTDATLFRYDRADYLVDVDPQFYAARYLRAWQLAATLSKVLRERFDEDWYRNPRSGAFIQHLMSRGQADPADRLAVEASGEPLSFAPLLARLAAAL